MVETPDVGFWNLDLSQNSYYSIRFCGEAGLKKSDSEVCFFFNLSRHTSPEFVGRFHKKAGQGSLTLPLWQLKDTLNSMQSPFFFFKCKKNWHHDRSQRKFGRFLWSPIAANSHSGLAESSLRPIWPCRRWRERCSEGWGREGGRGSEPRPPSLSGIIHLSRAQLAPSLSSRNKVHCNPAVLGDDWDVRSAEAMSTITRAARPRGEKHIADPRRGTPELISAGCLSGGGGLWGRPPVPPVN